MHYAGVKSLTPISPPSGVPSATLQLPENLFWANELAWSPVAQSASRSLSGKLHIHALQRTAGRPIELRGDDRAKITRADLRVLLQWASIPLQKLTLWISGASFTVVFDSGADESGRAIESSPVFPFSDITDADMHGALVLRFLTVS